MLPVLHLFNMQILVLRIAIRCFVRSLNISICDKSSFHSEDLVILAHYASLSNKGSSEPCPSRLSQFKYFKCFIRHLVVLAVGCTQFQFHIARVYIILFQSSIIIYYFYSFCIYQF